MTALAYASQRPMSPPEAEWAELAAQAPMLESAARRYVDQVALSLRPGTIISIERSLRVFCRHLTSAHPGVRSFAQVDRQHVESFKLALAVHVSDRGMPLAATTVRQQIGIVRVFFDRMIEWGWDDAPTRNPLFATDLPRCDDPLPKALDDPTAARFMAALAAETDPLRRLCVELLARTGMRVGELCTLEADAVSQRSGGWWLKIPVGKLRTDRHIPLHPVLVGLLDDWQAAHHDNRTGLLLTNHGRPLNRQVVTRMVNRVARRAGLGHINPHRLRHTLATQAINRGMRIEAVADLLGHRDLKMTMRYARIANDTVAVEYRAASQRVETLYAEPDDLPESAAMRRLRQEHHRLLANGWCTRPKATDCNFEAVCEGCGHFATTVEFTPVLRRQRDHAADHRQPTRQAIYQRLLDGLEGGA